MILTQTSSSHNPLRAKSSHSPLKKDVSLISKIAAVGLVAGGVLGLAGVAGGAAAGAEAASETASLENLLVNSNLTSRLSPDNKQLMRESITELKRKNLWDKIEEPTLRHLMRVSDLVNRRSELMKDYVGTLKNEHLSRSLKDMRSMVQNQIRLLRDVNPSQPLSFERAFYGELARHKPDKVDLLHRVTVHNDVTLARVLGGEFSRDYRYRNENPIPLDEATRLHLIQGNFRKLRSIIVRDLETFEKSILKPIIGLTHSTVEQQLEGCGLLLLKHIRSLNDEMSVEEFEKRLLQYRSRLCRLYIYHNAYDRLYASPAASFMPEKPLTKPFPFIDQYTGSIRQWTFLHAARNIDPMCLTAFKISPNSLLLPESSSL